MTCSFLGIKTSHVYKNVKKHYYLIFKRNEKKAKLLGKYLYNLVTPLFCQVLVTSFMKATDSNTF